MTGTFRFLNKHWFFVSFAIISLFAIVLRFYNYQNRWILAGDQADFVLVSRSAISSFRLPFLGPFSSAGPFQTGGEWYWFVSLGSILDLHQVITPWVFLTFTYVGFVAGMIFLGQKISGRLFGLVVGVLACLSTAQITQSVNLSNQSPISLLALAAIFFMIMYLETQKNLFLFLLSFSIGIASSIHLSGMALLPLLTFTLLLGNLPNWKRWGLVLLGLLIPWLPVFFVDFHNHFFNTRNMIYYYFFEKNKPSFDVLGRNWKTFIKDFIPLAWSSIIGGYLFNGYLLFLLTAVFGIYAFFKKQLKKEFAVIFLSTVGMFIILRYTHTPLFDSFYVFLHPFILLASGWLIFFLYSKNRIVGILLLLLIILTTFFKDIIILSRDSSNPNPTRSQEQKMFLENKFPDKKFAIYDYQFKTSAYSQSLSLFLTADNKINDRGMKIGYASQSFLTAPRYPVIKSSKSGDYVLFDLESASDKILKKENWVSVTAKSRYNTVENWYKK